MPRHYMLPLVSRLKIVDKNLQTLVLGEHLTPPQRYLINDVEQQMTDGKPVRAIILKARQMGFSTAVEAMMFSSCFTLPGLKGLVVANENDNSQHLLSMSRFYWDTFWMRDAYTPKNEAANKLAWYMPGGRVSSMAVKTAKNVMGGRGITAHFLHNSEAAFYQDPEELMRSMGQALPRSQFSFQFIESTANGVGNWFHKFWLAAKAGDVAHHAIFFAWWQHPYYTADHIGMSERAGRPIVDLDEEERLVWKGLQRIGFDDRDIRSRLIWRREILNTECAGDVETFHQEYPTTDEEAFIATGRNVFNLRYLRLIYAQEKGRRGRLVRDGSRVRFVEDDTGPLVIYREPRGNSWYTIGGDPSKAARYGDFAAAQVIDRQSWEQVATFRQRGIDPSSFAEQLLLLGVYYNEGLIAPETNMSGGAVAEILRTSYTNVWQHQKANKVPGQIDNMYGWVSNVQTKAEAIHNLQKALIDAAQPEALARGVGLKIHDPATFNEMVGYVQNEKGDYENSFADNVLHDDTVMSLAIALTVTIYEAALLVEGSLDPYSQPHHVGPRDGGHVTEFDAKVARGAAMVGAETSAMVTETEDGKMMLEHEHSDPFAWEEDGVDMFAETEWE